MSFSKGFVIGTAIGAAQTALFRYLDKQSQKGSLKLPNGQTTTVSKSTNNPYPHAWGTAIPRIFK